MNVPCLKSLEPFLKGKEMGLKSWWLEQEVHYRATGSQVDLGSNPRASVMVGHDGQLEQH